MQIEDVESKKLSIKIYNYNLKTYQKNEIDSGRFMYNLQMSFAIVSFHFKFT